MFFFLIVFPTTSLAGVYKTPMTDAATWLVSQQNSDGSWGSGETIKFLYTSEAVTSLGKAFLVSPSYLNGIAWLENHFTQSSDLRSRRVSAISNHGNDLSSDVAELESAQRATGGWGATGVYESSPLDTALTLLSLGANGTGNGIGSAVDYLASKQLSGPEPGWALFDDTQMDAVTTSLVLRALIPLEAQYPAATPSISAAVTALTAVVDTDSANLEKVHTALALLAHDINSVKGLGLLGDLLAAQHVDGSLGQDVYATTLMIQAFAKMENPDPEAAQTLVQFPDIKLQEFINLFLGRNRADAIRFGDLAQLTSLNLSGTGITTLVGLEGATNLTDITVDIDQGQYLSTDADNLYAGLLEELNTLSGNLNNVTLNFNGFPDDSDDGVKITVATEIFMNGTTRALDLNGKNIHQGVAPIVTLADTQLEVLSFTDIEGDTDQVIVALPEGELNGNYDLVLTNTLGKSTFYVRLVEPYYHDGTTWELVTAAAAFGKRRYIGTVVFDGKMWVMGGHGYPNVKLNDIWNSSDGVNWTQVTPVGTHWSERERPKVVNFKGEMWLIGGNALSGGAQNDVWHSPDGINWTQVTSPAIPFAARYDHDVVVYDDKIWVVAGNNSSGYLDDVWSSPDGINWTQVNPGNPSPWVPNYGFASLAYDDKLWVVGGATVTADSWSTSDGNTWSLEQQITAMPRHYLTTSLVYDNLMWILGGLSLEGGVYDFNDVWSSSDGKNWFQATAAAPWGSRYGHGALVFDNKMWVLGGITETSWHEDVWVTAPSP